MTSGFLVVLDEDLRDDEQREWVTGLLLQIKGVKEVVPLVEDRDADHRSQVLLERQRHELFDKVHRVFFPGENQSDQQANLKTRGEKNG